MKYRYSGFRVNERRLPVGLDVVWSPEKLDLPRAGRESLYHAVDLVWFVTGGADLEKKSQNINQLRSLLQAGENH